jgi:hypothetical protein
LRDDGGSLTLATKMMTADKRTLVLINLLGGFAVLGSYIYCLATNPTTRSNLWGNVPDELRPAYTISMLLATAGYFAFSHFVLFRIDARAARIGGSYGYRLFLWVYAGILAPSALWMPLTLRMFEAPSSELWIAIRIVLGLVGASSLLLVWAIAAARPAGPGWARALALVGAVAFAVQTAVLDALVWPYYFPLPS